MVREFDENAMLLHMTMRNSLGGCMRDFCVCLGDVYLSIQCDREDISGDLFVCWVMYN